MISGATRGSGGAALGLHLAYGQNTEAITDGPARGLVEERTVDRIDELTRLGSHAKTRYPLYHIHADPPTGRPWTLQERADYWTRMEAELGFQRQPFASTMHVKGDREHEHRVYLRTRPDGTAIRLDHDFARREKVDRVTEYERGEALTRGAHNRAVIAALYTERPEIADAMRNAGLHEGPRPVARLTPTERLQEQRTGITKDDIARDVSAAWKHSGSGSAFAAALAERGLRLAQGDRCAVVIDGTGNIHAVQRMLSMAAKASKTDAPKAAAVIDRLDGLELPSVAEATAAPAPKPQAVVAFDGVATPVVVPVVIAKVADQTPVVAPAAQSNPSFADTTGGGKNTAAQTTGGGTGTTSGGSEPGSAEVSLGDVGEGPGEPPGVNASPDETAKWLAKDQAFRERKAGLWAAWLASQKPHTQATALINKGPGGENNVDIQRQAEAGAEAIRQLINDLGQAYQRAHCAAEIRRAISRFEADAARIRAGAGQHGDDSKPGVGSQAGVSNVDGDARTRWDGGRPLVRVDGAEIGAGAEPDRRNPDGAVSRGGEPGQDRAAARAAFADATTQVRIKRALQARPESLARLRAATATLQVDPFGDLSGRARFKALSSAREALYARYTEQRTASRDAGRKHWPAVIAEQRTAAGKLAGTVRGAERHAPRDVGAPAWTAVKSERTATIAALKAAPKPPTFDEWLTAQSRTDPTARAVASAVAEQRERRAAAAARVADDRARIAAVLATHPHPDSGSRNSEAQEAVEEREAREEHAARVTAEAASAEAASQAAFRNRSPATWLRNVLLGSPTAQQRQALDTADYADQNKNTRPDNDTLRAARERGRLLAMGARDRADAWERKPDVAAAIDQDRLNGLAAEAAASGDPAITCALRAGDPDAARAVIRDREEAQFLATEELERRLMTTSGRPAAPGEGGPTPGPRGPR